MQFEAHDAGEDDGDECGVGDDVEGSRDEEAGDVVEAFGRRPAFGPVDVDGAALEYHFDVHGNDEQDEEDHQGLDHVAGPLCGVEDAQVGAADAEFGQCEGREEEDLSRVGVLLGHDGVIRIEGGEVTSCAMSDLAILTAGPTCRAELSWYQ